MPIRQDAQRSCPRAARHYVAEFSPLPQSRRPRPTTPRPWRKPAQARPPSPSPDDARRLRRHSRAPSRTSACYKPAAP